MTTNQPMLEGIRIVDMTTILFGPTCTQMLADMGADVIKVESPKGDQLRHSGTSAKTPGMGPVHMTVNRGKRSLALDLKSEADIGVMRDLLATADVFIHNVRSSAIARLGLDYDSVRRIKDDLIYVHCTGFGSGGPYAGRKAIDDIIQAASGFASLSTLVTDDPNPRYTHSALADKVAGLHASQAVLAAVVHRLRTGEGQHVEVPMFECFTQFFLQEHLYDAVFRPPTGPIGYTRQLETNRRPFPTSDGFIAMAPYSDPEWIRLLEILGISSLLDDDRYNSPEQRFRNQGELYLEIRKASPAFSCADLMRECEKEGIAALALTQLEDILDNQHLKAVDFFHRSEHPSEGGYLSMYLPTEFGARARQEGRHAPLIGEHNQEIIDELAQRKSSQSESE